MTALKRYQRLEALGLWRANPEAQRLNVAVSIGDATLTLTDMSDTPLAHWSLPAVRRLNPGVTPALYAPSGEPAEPETLEIDEQEMIDAIETVRRAIDRAQPRSGRLRLVITIGLLAAGVGAAVVWLPPALIRHTVSALPEAVRASVGQHLLTQAGRVTGSPCNDPKGQAALDLLAGKLAGNAGARQVLVISSGVDGARHLPGGIILLNSAQVEDYDGPNVAAGYILAETQRAAETDPLVALLDHAGTFATARLLTTGKLPDTVLASYAEVVFTQSPAAVASEPLLARFAEAGVRSTPYAFAIDASGETTLTLIEADPVSGAAASPLLSDGEWAALQGICAQ